MCKQRNSESLVTMEPKEFNNTNSGSRMWRLFKMRILKYDPEFNDKDWINDTDINNNNNSKEVFFSVTLPKVESNRFNRPYSWPVPILSTLSIMEELQSKIWYYRRSNYTFHDISVIVFQL